MGKLPKRLSSIRARSTSLSTKDLDWQHRTSERSGSSIIAAMMNNGPRVPDSRKTSRKEKYYVQDGKKIPVDVIDNKIEIIIKRIKREENRIRKMKAFGTPPVGKETEEDKARVAKIMRKEAIVNTLHFQLQNYNTAKQQIDARELHKKLNKDAVNDGILVKTEKKYVPAKDPVLIPHRNVEFAGTQKVQFVPGKRRKMKVLLNTRDEMEMVRKEKAITEARALEAKKEKLSKLSMSEIIKVETTRQDNEQKERFDAIDKKIKEILSDEDFENMFK